MVDDLLPNIPWIGNLLLQSHHIASTFSGLKRRFNPPKYTGPLIPIFDYMRDPALPRPVAPEVQEVQEVQDADAVMVEPIDLNVDAMGDEDEDMADADYVDEVSDSEEEEVFEGLVSESDLEGDDEDGEDLNEGNQIVGDFEGDVVEDIIGEIEGDGAVDMDADIEGELYAGVGSPLAFNLHDGYPSLEANLPGDLHFSPPGSSIHIDAPSSSVNLIEPYIPQPISGNEKTLTVEVDEDVEIDFDFEHEMDGSDNDQVLVVPDDVTILEPVVQILATQTPPISTVSIGVQIPEPIIDFFDDSEHATGYVDQLTEDQAREQLKKLILKNRELESAKYSSEEAARLRVENERLREVIEKQESEISMKNYLLKSKDTELVDRDNQILELQTEVENSESLSHSKDVLIANLEEQVAELMKQTFDLEKVISSLKKDKSDEDDGNCFEGDDEGGDGDDSDFDDDSDDDGGDDSQMYSDKQMVVYDATTGSADTSLALSRTATALPSPFSTSYVIDELARSLFLTPLVQKFFDSSLPEPESSELVPSKTLSEIEKKWIRRTVRDFDRKEKKRSYLAASLIKSPIQAESAPILAITSDEAGPSSVDKGKRKADDSPTSSPKCVKYIAFSERELASLAAFVDAPDVDPA